MNICCFAITNYWQGIKGGMNLHARVLGEALVENGHEVRFISTGHPDMPNAFVKNGVKYSQLQNTLFGSRRCGWPKNSIEAYRHFHAKNEFDLLWSQSFDAYGLCLIRSKGIRPPLFLRLAGSVVQECRSVWTNVPLLSKRPLDLSRAVLGLFYSYFATQRPLMNCADEIVVVSDVVVEDIRKWFGRRLASKCRVINNGVDTSVFKPDKRAGMKVRSRYGAKGNETLLLSLGRITHEKGHHLAIEAVAELEKRGLDCKLLIVGAGPRLEELEENVFRRGLATKVFFAGHVENERLSEYYNAADIFLMPTLTVEGLPFALIESMSCGTPAVVSRIGGNTTIIENGKDGLMHSPGNVSEMADLVEALRKNDCLSGDLSKAARKKVLANYSLEKMIRNYIRAMERAVEKGRCPMESNLA